jgi:NADH-quinone oxidoreductase subunit J
MTPPTLPLAAAVPPAAEAALFYLFALLSGGSALAVVASRNIVRMSVALLFALTGVAGIFFLLQAEFLAAVQLVVYVGGTLILIVFGVMLTSKSPFTVLEPTRGEVGVAFTLAALLVLTLIIARSSPEAHVPLQVSAVPAALREGQASHGVRYDSGSQSLRTSRRLSDADRTAVVALATTADAPIGVADHAAFTRAVDLLASSSAGLPAMEGLDPNARYPMTTLGLALLGDYLLPFELASVLLLAVMIGAAYLARARRREAS